MAQTFFFMGLKALVSDSDPLPLVEDMLLAAEEEALTLVPDPFRKIRKRQRRARRRHETFAVFGGKRNLRATYKGDGHCPHNRVQRRISRAHRARLLAQDEQQLDALENPSRGELGAESETERKAELEDHFEPGYEEEKRVRPPLLEITWEDMPPLEAEWYWGPLPHYDVPNT